MTLRPDAVRPTDPGYPPPAYRWYVVGVLALAYIFAHADRQILNLLVGPIRRDLDISDTQMSLLMGFSFAVFYTFFGILAGRLADRGSRRGLIAAGMVLWSLVTAACGLAQRFWHFLVLRMGVGVGEATLNPSAYSLIADYFPPQSRATALGVYGMGIYIGSGLAFVGGGLMVSWASAREALALPLVGAIRPWQAVFFIVGLAGALAAALFVTVQEPERRETRPGARASVREVWAYLRANGATVLSHNLGFALLALSGFGTGAWLPSLLIRRFDWTAAQAGVVQGIIVMVFGTLGVVTGGWLADRLARSGVRDATMRVGLIAALAWLPTGLLYPLMPNGWLAVVLFAPSMFFLAWPFGVAPAAIQAIMPNDMRAQASALYLFAINLIGLGLGPTGVALLTDYVFRDDASVHYSILLVTGTAQLGAAAVLWRGLEPFRRSRERFEAQLVVPPSDAGHH